MSYFESLGGNYGQIRTCRQQIGEKRNASQKTWNAAIWEGGKRGRRKEQKASDSEWIVGSTQERSKGSEEIVAVRVDTHLKRIPGLLRLPCGGYFAFNGR
jgi:hypothetical protein